MIYRDYAKRIIDFSLSITAMVVLCPLFFGLIIAGSIEMRGNPFFVQKRPGRNGSCFRLIKFRTMTNEKDINGNYLPDEKRLKIGRAHV